MHPSPEAHGPVGRSRRFGAPPRSLLESCRVTPAQGRPTRDSARRLPLGCPYAQQARVPASGSRRTLRHTQRNAARAQFWLGAADAEIHAAVPLCVHHSLEGKHVLHALRSRERGCFLVVQTLWAEKIQSTTDAGSLNTFGRNEIEVAPISSALLRIWCLVILNKTGRVPDQELAADRVSSSNFTVCLFAFENRSGIAAGKAKHATLSKRVGALESEVAVVEAQCLNPHNMGGTARSRFGRPLHVSRWRLDC